VATWAKGDKVKQQERNPAETYQHYFGPAIFEPWAEVLLSHARPQAGEKVLDVACGTGIVARMVSSQNGGAPVVGVDFNPDMLKVARDLSPPDAPLRFLEAGAEELPLENGEFDLLLCQQGLQFFHDKDAAAREMVRVLVPGGRTVVAVWQGLDQHDVFRALFEAEAKHLNIDSQKLAKPFSYGSADEMRKLFLNAGFARVEVVAETRTVSFPEPEKFIQLTVIAGAAVIPELAQATPEEHDALVQAVMDGAGEVVREHRRGDRLEYPMTTNIALAWK
jgi:SAM-dependent methyltransferase